MDLIWTIKFDPEVTGESPLAEAPGQILLESVSYELSNKRKDDSDEDEDEKKKSKKKKAKGRGRESDEDDSDEEEKKKKKGKKSSSQHGPEVGRISLTKSTDAASLPLYLHCLAGDVFTSAVITGWTIAAGSYEPIFSIALDTVLITSMGFGGDDMSEDMELYFEGIAWRYRQLKTTSKSQGLRVKRFATYEWLVPAANDPLGLVALFEEPSEPSPPTIQRVESPEDEGPPPPPPPPPPPRGSRS